MYAVLETGGKQYRVTAGETLDIERLALAAGQPHTFDRVLMVSKDDVVTVGSPLVAGALVKVDILTHKRGVKVNAFKMRRRKGYHRKVGHRQELTVIKVTEITA